MKLGRTLVVGTVAGLALAVFGRFQLQAQPAASPLTRCKGGTMM